MTVHSQINSHYVMNNLRELDIEQLSTVTNLVKRALSLSSDHRAALLSDARQYHVRSAQAVQSRT